MKKLIAGVVTAVVLSGGMAHADDAQVSVGLKGWSNSWEVKNSGTTSTLKSDNSVLMVGPSQHKKR